MLSESQDRGAKSIIVRDLRPRPPGHVWAWIVIAVCTVIFLSITLWVVVAGRQVVTSLGGREAVHQVSQPWAQRWAQAPGPPSEYNRLARTAVSTGDVAEALRLTSMSLALDPNQATIWAQMTCLSTVDSENAYAMTEPQRQTLVDILNELDDQVDGLAVADQWSGLVAALQANDRAAHQFLSDCMNVKVADGPLKTTAETLDTLDASP